jgi:two-component system, cell cycle response regulator
MTDKELDELKAQFPILLAEDNDIARKYLEKILNKAGYSVVPVENGKKALEMFHQRFFSIVLTDWLMPEMSGLELCEAIRQKENKGYVFIVLLTAKDSKQDIIRGLEAGADDYLTKPVNYGELIARLNSGTRILHLEKNLKEANEKIRILSITDPLTGCYNRGYMMPKFALEVKRGGRYMRPLSLIFCDLDHFKQINDTYGHQAGDHVLKEFALCINELIRADVDWITRYGGEEFLLILPETPPESAYGVAERIRLAFAERKIVWDGVTIPVTASFGVTGFDESTNDFDITPDAIIKEADQNLYRSKREGRNCTTFSIL